MNIFHLTLTIPVVMDSQLAELAPKLGYDAYDLRQIANHELPGYWIFTEDIDDHKQLDVAPIHIKHYEGAWTNQLLPNDIPRDCLLTGTNAIGWLCWLKGVPFEPLVRIEVPTDVYRKAKPMEWYGISCLFANIVVRNQRLAKLTKLEAPEIILRAEEKYLWQEIEMLENPRKFGFGAVLPDGKRAKGLTDLGYSLVDGWEDEEQEDE